MNSVCFTGHRHIKSSDMLQLKSVLDSTVTSLVKRGATEFYCGGALGWDTMCANMVLYLRKRKGFDIHLHLVLPCSNEEQTAKWSDSDKKMFYDILKNADSVEYTAKSYTPTCMKQRNARLVELADCCVCYYDENNSRSGTGQTVRIAQSKGIEVINLTELI